MFTHNAPLFGGAGERRPDVLPANGRPYHRTMMARGASCGVARVMSGAGAVTAAGTPIAADNTTPLMRATGKLSTPGPCPRHPLSAGALGPRRPNADRTATAWRLPVRPWSGDVAQLLLAEEAARWKLRHQEQTERVDLALQKPAACLPRSCSSRAAGSRCHSSRGAAPQTRVSSAEPSFDASVGTHASHVGDKTARSKKHRVSGRRRPGTATARSSAEVPEPAVQVPPPMYVRDSELLRALQRAEARIAELEAQASLTPEQNRSSSSISTVAAAPYKLHEPSLLTVAAPSYSPLAKRLAIV